MLINTKMKAKSYGPAGGVRVMGSDGDGGETVVADFPSPAHFYLLTGFKTAEAFNEAQADKPTTFLQWERKH